MIYPKVMIQQAKNADPVKGQPSSFPRLKIRTGQKFIVEDGNTSQSEGNGVKGVQQKLNFFNLLISDLFLQGRAFFPFWLEN